MIQIRIAQKLRPFSHRPNTVCLIPGTGYVVQACPTLFRIKDLSGNLLKEMPLSVQGPLDQFTMIQDLERGCVTIFSEAYRYHVLPNLKIISRKNPGLPPLVSQERLSLGSHKKQDWESIVRRGDFKEIFPIWFRLGSLLKLPKREGKDLGMFELLKQCRDAVDSSASEKIIPVFRNLFLAGFSNMLLPRLFDEDFQGILPATAPLSEASPLYLLSEGAEIIRSLFISVENENKIAILPHLPPEFFAGRMVHLDCAGLGTLDLEWSKKTVRSVAFYSSQNAEITFKFRSSLRSFRLRQTLKEQGRRVACGDSLEIKSDRLYLLDQFKK